MSLKGKPWQGLAFLLAIPCEPHKLDKVCLMAPLLPGPRKETLTTKQARNIRGSQGKPGKPGKAKKGTRGNLTNKNKDLFDLLGLFRNLNSIRCRTKRHNGS